MQLPLTLKVYLVACPVVSPEAVLGALEGFNDASRGLAPAFDELEVIEASELDDDMRGFAILLGDDTQLATAAEYTSDTAIATVGSTCTAAELVGQGFATALPAYPDADRLAAAVVNLAREALLRRRLDVREYAYDTYFRISDNMLWTKDLRDFHMDVNHYLNKLTGKQLSEIEGKHEIEVYNLDPNDPGCGESDRLVRETRRESYFEESMPDMDGVRHHLDVVKAPWFDGQGRLVGTIGIGKDTTDLLNQQARFVTFLNSIGLAVAITDTEDRFVQANDTFLELVGGDLRDREHVDELIARTMVRLEGLGEGGDAYAGDFRFVSEGAEGRIWSLDRFFLKDYWDEHTGFTYIFQDVTEDRLQRLAIQEMAVTDPLTGVSNRAGLYDHYDSFAPDTHGAFLFIDIDDFKKVNDSLGHDFGDEYLVEATRLITEVLPGAFLTRYGGDEFFAVLPEAMSDEASADAAKAILDGVRELPAYERLPEGVGSFSIGIVADAPFSEDIDAIIQRCDTAMYEAKRSGKNRFCLA